MHATSMRGTEGNPVPAGDSSGNGVSPRILCGTDFSVGARLAADAAGALARRQDATLILLHVVEQSLLDLLPSEMRKSLLDSSHERLVREATRVREAGTRVEERFLVGSSEDLIVEESRSSGAAGIVLASLGSRQPVRWLVGSVTERVAEHADVPTWVVRDGASLLAWAQGRRPLRVLVAFDLTASAEAALRWAAGLRQWGECEYVVGYADWPPDERARLGSSGASPLLANPPEMQRYLERDVRSRADAVLGGSGVRVRVQANWGRPELCLADMARAEGVDLVVVGSHQRHGLGRWWNHSVSRGILHHAPMTVVVVPSSHATSPAGAAIPRFRRVLVATDFSTTGDHAIPSAYGTLPPGSTVRLVHVRVGATPKAGTDEASGADAERSALLRRLEGRIPSGAADQGIVTEAVVVDHPVAGEAISQEAERFGADVVCLGTHGHSGIAESLLGSVSRAVLTQTRRPVMLVRLPTP